MTKGFITSPASSAPSKPKGKEGREFRDVRRAQEAAAAAAAAAAEADKGKGKGKGKQPAGTGGASAAGASGSGASGSQPRGGGASGSNGPANAAAAAGAAGAAGAGMPAYVIRNWTGKTPATLLSEFCQKHQLGKPQWNSHQKGGKHRVSIILTKEDKKTRQPLTLNIDPPELYEHPMEAKHMAAVCAMHRLNSHLNLSHILPPDFRDYWAALDVLKKNDTEGIWPAAGGDPFQPVTKADVERAQQKQAASEQRQAELKQREEDAQLAVIHLSEAQRTVIEALVKEAQQETAKQQAAASSEAEDADEPSPSTSTSNKTSTAVYRDLLALGFHARHIDEALGAQPKATAAAQEAAALKSAALSWLCLHVPEQDLPVQFRPDSKQLTASFHANTTSLAQSYMIQRLREVGFGQQHASMALEACGYDEDAALLRLLHLLKEDRLTDADAFSATVPAGPPSARFSAEEIDSAAEQVAEEIAAVESIYGVVAANVKSHAECSAADCSTDSVVRSMIRPTASCISVCLAVPEFKPHLVELELKFPSSTCLYPNETPIVVIRHPALTSTTRLVLQRAAFEFAASLAPAPLLYSLIDWVQTSGVEVVQNPPPLSTSAMQEAAAAAAAASSSASSSEPAPADAASATPAARTGKDGKQQQRRRPTPAFKKVFDKRSKLPSHSYVKEILSALAANQVVVISGETGCGKTTQVPQFILDALIDQNQGSTCRLLCTQPRRISALSVAERVAVERAEKIGEGVGYSVRLEAKYSASTRLLFSTIGVLLRFLQDDPLLNAFSHIVIDEVHERGVESDFVLIALREVLAKRRDLRLVLMSATLDSNTFSSYFGGVPVISIPGFAYPVEILHLEDVVQRTSFRIETIRRGGAKSAGSRPRRGEEDGTSSLEASTSSDFGSSSSTSSSSAPPPAADAAEAVDPDAAFGISMAIHSRQEDMLNVDLIAATVMHICTTTPAKEDVLIFASGMQEIKQCVEAIMYAFDALPRATKGNQQLLVLPLHSTLSVPEQKRVFDATGATTRKVVVSTNVAETSVTVDGIVHVIDTGRVKETRYDAQRGMSSLEDTWISKANARQRKGRAGRTQAGICYRLFTSKRSELMADHQAPEILRVPLEQLCLQVKAMGTADVVQFLGKALTPPDTKAVTHAIDALVDIGALHRDTKALTPLGVHLASIPVDARIAKVLIFGAIFHCLDPILTVAACMGFRSPFITSVDKRAQADEVKKRFAIGKSDLLGYSKAYAEWHNCAGDGAASKTGARRKFCEDNFLSMQSMQGISDLRKQFLDILASIGFVPAAIMHHHKQQDAQAAEAHRLLNANSTNIKVLKAVLAAGLYPQVASVVPPERQFVQVQQGMVVKEAKASELKLLLKGGTQVFVHPTSATFSLLKMDDRFVLYNEKMATSKAYLRDTTVVSAYPLILFGGNIAIEHEQHQLLLDGWIKIKAPARVATLVTAIRQQLDAVLSRKIEQPLLNVYDSAVVRAIMKLVESDGY
ncbi:helicase domain-containing protein [Capsaspora owczarzaki ATCC 30864]|uniref:helicase domain-containing protein n=1 Tax=Capsaspora owczarzaki (strain ATCC 30864) TaxID=595528 RepID=UPI0001FE2712|nr:helicase domain-containing protein [Capsaspora owczarzaki ATCC 30864]|eukprot:XP_004346668.1 helicase domain-containing protein [Capsaspora owczarzaki ATCC 30864]